MAIDPSSDPDHRARAAVAFLLFLALLSIAFHATAWVCDDAFITFRVVENALDGLGLRWNPSERVQAFTHPLWLFLLLPLTWALDDPWWSSLLLSYAFLVLTIALVLAAVGTRFLPALVAPFFLVLSRSFVDYSSSGLENPLLHALVAAYCVVWLRSGGNRRLVLLHLIVAATWLTRPDGVVLLVPGLLAAWWEERRRPAPVIRAAAIGALPIVCWIAFSLLYYGAPVPNTALAKVGTGLELSDRVAQGLAYLGWSWTHDRVTVVLLVVATGAGVAVRRLRPLACAIAVWIAYVLAVGGDFMGGRFLSAATVLAAIVLGCALAETRERRAALATGAVLALHLPALSFTLLSPATFAQGSIAPSGIADERGFYYRATGLVPAIERKTWRAHPWLAQGALLRNRPGVYTRCAVGMTGYAAGPAVHWVDPLALTEPFLARLPARRGSRVGHYERAFPPGYLESVVNGTNELKDPALAALYRDVRQVVSDPLFSLERIRAIWRLNSGHHSDAAEAFDREAIGLPGVPIRTRSRFSCYGLPYGQDGIWSIEGHPTIVRPVIFRPAVSSTDAPGPRS